MKIGMGWLGWTEAETLDTSMPVILLAYAGRMDMLQRTFGASSSETPTAKPEPELDTRAAGAMLFGRIKQAAKQ